MTKVIIASVFMASVLFCNHYGKCNLWQVLLIWQVLLLANVLW